MRPPLLSIAVPTHNRSRYAVHAIRSLLAIRDSRIEIVVSDTSATDELGNLLNEDRTVGCDPRLRYFRPDARLDMTGNHNAAIAATTGEFVCLIGDDDTVTHDAIKAVEWANQKSIDVLAPQVVSNYVWPDFRSRFFGAGHAARLYLPSRVTPPMIVDSDQAFESALRSAAQGTDELPKLYHGFVRRSVLNQIREASGAFFHGSSPDVSAAIALALTTTTFARVGFPLTIPGASGGSNTGRSAMNQHKGKLSHEEQTRTFKDTGWSPGVPAFFSVETVWAHAALETIRRLSPQDEPRFNYARLIALCLSNHDDFAEDIAAAIDELTTTTGVSRASFLAKVARERKSVRLEKVKKVIKRLRNPTASGGRPYVGNLSTIADAPAALSSALDRANWSWNSVSVTD